MANKKMRLSYEEWKALVDKMIGGITKTDMDSEWIPDYDYYKEYVAGTSPARAAAKALQASRNF
jgi:hypothetical protein